MLQPRICGPCPSPATKFSLRSFIVSLTVLTIPSTKASATFVRHASHAAQSQANGPKDSAGRRLGAKKSASEYVIPGNIIFRQRGTKWHPGDNVGMGKDHTIYATVSGYVRYYRDPFRHPDRRFIGVALEREGPGSVLPRPQNAATRRRLGMYAAPLKPSAGPGDATWLESHMSANSKMGASIAQSSETGGMNVKVAPPRGKAARPKYSLHWESNWSIGRTAERKGIKVREYDRNDRWLAWRKRNQRFKKSLALKAMKSSRMVRGGKKKVQRRAT